MLNKHNSSKIKVNTIDQVAIIVKDVQKTAESYWNKLGIGPWDIYSIESSMILNARYKGKSAKYGYEYDTCKSGPCELKLIQPTDGENMFSNHITKYGEGLQHLQYVTVSLEEAKQHVKILNDLGFPTIMDGYMGDGYFAYLDTSSKLGCVWGVTKKSSSRSLSISHYQFPAEKDEKSPAILKVKGMSQVALITDNLLKIIESYWNILGIGPWTMVICKPPLTHNLTYKSEIGNFTAYVGFANTGGLEVEPVEPLTGRSIYKDFLDEFGVGLHHIQFLVDDSSETKKAMNTSGFPILSGLGFSDGESIYYDTNNELKTIWEGSQAPKNMPELEHYP